MEVLDIKDSMADLAQMKQFCDALEISYDNLSANKYGQRTLLGTKESPIKLIQVHDEGEDHKPYIAWVVAGTPRKWSGVKTKLIGFGKPSPEINSEGYFRFYRLPNKSEAKKIRHLLGLSKKRSKMTEQKLN